MSERKTERVKMKETPTKNKHSEETVDCAKCSMTYAKSDVSKHKLWCVTGSDDHFEAKADESVSWIRSIPARAAHGFIYRKRHLFGQVINDFGAPKELQALACSRLRERLVFLNSKSMRDCGLKLGDHVIVSVGEDGSEKAMASVVWPSSKVALFHVGIPKATCDQAFRTLDNRHCSVSKIPNLKRATRLCLTPTPAAAKSFHSSEDFVRTCIMYLNGTCLKSPEDIVRIPYFGQVCVMKAISTLDHHAVEGVAGDSSSLSLTEALSTLELTETEEHMANDLNRSSRTSTPVHIESLENGATPPPAALEKQSYVQVPSFNVDQRFALVDESTAIIVEVENTTFSYRPTLTFSDLGGMERTKEVLYDHVAVCLRENVGDRMAMKTILLYGMAGCGKTSLAEAAAAEVGANFLRLDASIAGAAEDSDPGVAMGFSDLDSALRTAEKHSPCVVLIDDIENISDKAKKSLGTLTSWIEKIMKNSSRICVIGATSSIERLNGGLRKRFQFEIEVPVPTAADRKLILQKMLVRCGGVIEDGVDTLADRTHGFTPSDLSTLLKEAVVVAHKRLKFAGMFQVELEDFHAALTSVRPSAMREIFVEVPKVRWSDVGGNEEVKLKLQQTVEWPLQHPEKFVQLGIKPPTGILMYGPPGCSKTMIAKALATESGLNFLSVKGPELFSKWVGESERAVRDLFRKARQVAPSIIFFDEIDAIASERSGAGGSGSSSNVSERVLAQMLTEMDGIQPLTNVTIVAATNRPDVIDRALLRPGRLDISIYVRLPDARTREQILKLELAKKRISEGVDVLTLVEKTDRYTGAELVALCNEAGLTALSESRMADVISGRHLEKALSVIRPRISDESLRVYERFEVCCRLNV